MNIRAEILARHPLACVNAARSGVVSEVLHRGCRWRIAPNGGDWSATMIEVIPMARRRIAVDLSGLDMFNLWREW